jgi:hypothetical protein
MQDVNTVLIHPGAPQQAFHMNFLPLAAPRNLVRRYLTSWIFDQSRICLTTVLHVTVV